MKTKYIRVKLYHAVYLPQKESVLRTMQTTLSSAFTTQKRACITKENSNDEAAYWFSKRELKGIQLN